MKFSRAISRVRWFSSTTLGKRTEMVFETLVSKKLNHLTRLIARENFIILTRQESIKLYIVYYVLYLYFGMYTVSDIKNRQLLLWKQHCNV